MLEQQKKAFLRECRSLNKSAATLINYEKVIRLFADYLTEQGGELSPDAVISWRDYLTEQGRSPTTVKVYLESLSSFLSFLVKRGELSENPVNKGITPTIKDKAYTLLNREEIEYLLNRTKKAPYEQHFRRNQAIFSILILSGLRSDELRSLRICDLDFDGGTITVRNGKGGKMRIVPFPEQSQRTVKAYIESDDMPPGRTESDLLFATENPLTGEYGKMASSHLNSLIKKVCRRAIGKDIHIHTLRHAAASLWADSGANIRDVQLALGHSSVQITENVYTHVLRRTAAAENINRALQTNNA